MANVLQGTSEPSYMSLKGDRASPAGSSVCSSGTDNEIDASTSSSASTINGGGLKPPEGKKPSRRKSLAGLSASPSSPTTGTFLSRFIGNFRSPPPAQTRPQLPRSFSSPQQSSRPASQVAAPSWSLEDVDASPVPSDSLNGSQRPSLAKRASSGASRSSSMYSSGVDPEAQRSTPGSPSTLRGRERDPMDAAIHARTGDARTNQSRDNWGRRGSTVSENTLRPEQTGTYTPTGDRAVNPLDTISEPAGPMRLHRPLDVIATLLPPAVQLLSQLGPTHLFSPPLVLPSLIESAHGDSAHSDTTGAMSDRASIASSITSSSSLNVIGTSSHIAHTFSHELHAPNTLSVPAVSAAAIWRLFRGFEWINEASRGTSAIDADHPPTSCEDDLVAFDFPSALQGVADMLASEAASRDVELVIGQVGSGSAPSPVTSPVGDEPPTQEQIKEKDVESRELLVRGDERAWSIVLAWILHHIIASATPGTTVEVRFLATSASSSVQDAGKNGEDEDETSEAGVLPEKLWSVSLEILHTLSATASLSSQQDLPSPPFDTHLARALLSQLSIELEDGPADANSRSWVMRAQLASPRPKLQSEDPAETLGRRRASLEPGTGQEPSMNDLKRFADTTLKGQKVALHSGELSTFAKHLTTYLAGWGMDVSHVPLEVEDKIDATGEKGYGQHIETTIPHVSEVPIFKNGTSDSGSSVSGEGASNLIIVDDDATTLRRILRQIRSMPLNYAPTLLAKRPQLASRRTRSSPHVRQLHQLPTVNSSTVILHFASLSHYKEIKEIVQTALASHRTSSLPEILVVPKPAGPRRIITALWTALRRPGVDPSLPPIATSPSSAGVQYWTPRLSPALTKEQEFDLVIAETSPGANSSHSHNVKPRTPPAQGQQGSGHGGVSAPAGHPPSPLGKISDDQVSYFACVADQLEGTSSSQGMVIQSPDGQAGLFFQPTSWSSRVDKSKGRGLVEQVSSGGAPSEGTSRVPLATPHDIGLGQPRRTSSTSVSGVSSIPESTVPIGTPALSLDSFINAARSKAAGEDVAEDLPSSPSGGEALSRQISHVSGSSRASSIRAGVTSSNSSPRVAAVGGPSRRMTSGVQSPPAAAAPASPNLAAQSAARARESIGNASPATGPVAAPTSFSRRRTTSSAKNPKKPTRRNTVATVPPINVLIVEDNPINQTILSMFMKKKGIKYAVAKDGEEAVQKWKAGSFHLVLMDIQLPVKSGIEAAREIRAMERANNIGTFAQTPTPSTEPTSPGSLSGASSSASTSAPSSLFSSPISPPLSMPVIIVALTASSLQADRVTALAAGCNDFLTKPVSLPWLQQKLLEWGSMAYLSGFSSRSDSSMSSGSASKSETNSPQSQASSRRRSPRSASLYNVELRSRADDISAHLHIDPRHHGRRASPSQSPSRYSGDSRSSSPAPASASTITNAALPPPPPNTFSPPSRPENPLVQVISPTPVDTPAAAKVQADAPAPAPSVPSGAAQPTEVNRSRPADLDAVDERLQREGASRPAPSPLSNSTSVSDLVLEDVKAEGARLATIGRSGSSFGQAVEKSGMPMGDAPSDHT